jgi:hypothetical protein
MNKNCKFNKNSTNLLLPQSYTYDYKEGLLQYCQVQKKNPSLLMQQFGIFSGNSEFLCIYYMTSSGIPRYVLWNPGWETLP